MTSSLGTLGESYAAAYLEQLGYRLVAANFSLPVGRNRSGATINAEIDLVAYDGETLCFIEVKTRASDWFAPPEASIDLRKRRQIARAARAYRELFDLESTPFRFDVVSVVLSDSESPRVDLLKNYFTSDRLRSVAIAAERS